MVVENLQEDKTDWTEVYRRMEERYKEKKEEEKSIEYDEILLL